MFFGESSHSLDAKGRVTVPKRFLEGLTRNAEGNLVVILSAGQDGCVYLYSKPGFEATIARLNLATFAGEEQRAAQRLLFRSSFEVELDSAGRVLVPERLRSGARLAGEVLMIGVNDHAEVWAKDVWERYEATHAKALDNIDRILGSAGTAKG
ncbi:MAG: division/cell wall cluster transcriptional repressor MraZ [Planctomycetia bacterium]